MANGLQVRELAAAHDADDGARQTRGLDLAPQRLADVAEPRGRQADALGLGARQGRCGHGLTSWMWLAVASIVRGVPCGKLH